MCLGLFSQQLYTNNIIKDATKNKLELTRDIVNSKISYNINTLEQTINHVSYYISSGDYNETQILNFLTTILQRNDMLSSIYYVDKENKMINASGWVPPKDFDATKRPWYMEAINENKLIVTDVFLNASKTDFIITIAKPVYNENNQFMGVIGGDVHLEDITQIVQSIHIDNKEFLFIIDNKYQILVYSRYNQKNKNSIKLIGDISPDLNRSSFKNYMNTKLVTINNVAGYLSHTTIKDTGWTIGIFTPLSEAISSKVQLLNMFYIVLTISILMFVMLMFTTNKFIIKPIEDLAINISKLDIKKNLGVRLKENKKNPLNKIVQSINYLIDKINSLFVQLVKEKQKVSAIISSIPDSVVVMNKQGAIEKIYSGDENKIYKKNTSIVGENINTILSDDISKEICKTIAKVIETGRDDSFNYEIIVSNQLKYYESRYSKINDSQVIAISRDITKRKKQELKLIESEENFKRIFEGNSDAILIIEDYTVINCNNATLAMFNYSKKEDMIGKKPWDFSPEIQPGGENSKEAIHQIIDSMKNNPNSTKRFEFYHIKSNGVLFTVEIMLAMILINGKYILHSSLRDISKQKLLQEKLEYLSYHDQLTKLYNRWYFNEEIKRLDVKRNLPITIVMGDVNGLKLINDSFGHEYGDKLLIKASKSIIKGCREDDIVARMGGDEFAILLPKTDEFQTESIIKRINELAKEEKLDAIEVSISFGWETKYDIDTKIDEIFQKAEDRMYKKKVFDSPSMRGNTINTILKTLHEKNKREEEHSMRVSEYCEKLGKEMGLNDSKVFELKSVGLLHDIGKVAIPESILNKPGKLTLKEYEKVKTHSDIGYRILSTVNEMSDMANYILYHHERWDGKGYPRGLKEEEIPIQSRIIAIADAYDAMTSFRTYREPLTKEQAIQELLKNRGKQFDAKLIDIFVTKVLNEKTK